MATNKLLNIAFLSTCPPRECALTTFTEDLMDAIDTIGIVDTNFIAINNSVKRKYDNKVIYDIQQDNQQDYIDLALKLNNSNIDLLVIQYEYGIYGGDNGNYILDLLNNIEIPVVTILQTVLKNPSDEQKSIVKFLGDRSAKLITMARNTSKLLKTLYGISPYKIEVIQHGVPVKTLPSREALKLQFGYEDKQLISTFGFLNPSKGIEYAIKAIAKLAEIDPNVLYLILGQTHPDQENEAYREKLEALVKKLHLESNVKFVNKYLTKDEVIKYLQMSDVYMTPYLSRDLTISGTLAYAIGYGKAIISTPYMYAKEMLAEKRGLLAKFENPASIFNGLKYILHNPEEKLRMETNTLKLGETMYWDVIAKNYTSVFFKAIILDPKTGVI